MYHRFSFHFFFRCKKKEKKGEKKEKKGKKKKKNDVSPSAILRKYSQQGRCLQIAERPWCWFICNMEHELDIILSDIHYCGRPFLSRNSTFSHKP